MATKRTVAFSSCVAIAVVGLGILWSIDQQGPSDCAVVSEMLGYSESQSQEIQSSLSESMSSPRELLGAYEQRAERLSEYPPRISDQQLRHITEALRDLDVELIRDWSITIKPQNGDSDQVTANFLKSYSLYTARRRDLISDLDAACPEARK